MCLRMYKNSSGAGTMTGGGTESIIMAVKTHRDWARDVKGITEPEMYAFLIVQQLVQLLTTECFGSVIPASAHAAFVKAGAYLKIKVHSIPVNFKTRQANIKWMKRAM